MGKPRRDRIQDISGLPHAGDALGKSGLRLDDIRIDGWINTLSGIGDPMRDKRMGAIVVPRPMGYFELTSTYEASDVAGNIIDAPAEDMTREGWSLNIADEEDMADDVMGDLEGLNVDGRIEEALRYRGLYGGAGIVCGFDDGRQPWEPVSDTTTKGVQWLTCLNRWELVPVQYYGDPFAPKFAEPEIYMVSVAFADVDMGNLLQELQLAIASRRAAQLAAAKENLRQKVLLDPRNQFIHESRVLPYHGVRINRQKDRQHNGWGQSLLNRCANSIRDFDMSFQAAAVLVSDFAQAVWGVKGLAGLIASNNTDAFSNRLKGMDMARGVLRAIAIDSEETFKREVTPLGGLPELLDRISQRLASATRMPLTKLLGISPAGLNATGESDLRQWYDYVAAKQRKELIPQLNRLVRPALLARNAGAEPDKWLVRMNPLYQMSAAEEATMRFQVAQADNIYLQAGVVTPEEVADSRFGGAEWDMDTNLDLATREVQQDADKQLADAQQKAALEAAKNPPPPAPPGPTPGNGVPPKPAKTPTAPAPP